MGNQDSKPPTQPARCAPDVSLAFQLHRGADGCTYARMGGRDTQIDKHASIYDRDGVWIVASCTLTPIGTTRMLFQIGLGGRKSVHMVVWLCDAAGGRVANVPLDGTMPPRSPTCTPPVHVECRVYVGRVDRQSPRYVSWRAAARAAQQYGSNADTDHACMAFQPMLWMSVISAPAAPVASPIDAAPAADVAPAGTLSIDACVDPPAGAFVAGAPAADGAAHTCPVCTERISNYALPCFHILCGDCAARLARCPLCRGPARPARRLLE